MNVKIPFSRWLILALIIGVIISVGYANRAPDGNNEVALVNIISILLSVIASYLIAQYFAEKGHKEAIEEVKQHNIDNLKIYALNASEKVDNLSKELKRLSLFLEDELSEDFENPLEGYHSRTERIESAIHITNTLKSVNDTSLSDWRGVIPEELEEKDEEQIENAVVLEKLMERIEELTKNNSETNLGKDPDVSLRMEVIDLKQDLIQVSRKIDGIRIRPKRSSLKSKKESVKLSCPYCMDSISFEQRSSENSCKLVTCASCREKSLSRWYPEDGFILMKNVPKEETITCPSCENSFNEDINILINSPTLVQCPDCQTHLKVVRKANSIKINSLNAPPAKAKSPVIVDESLIEKVEAALPPQPWPKGIHLTISKQLKISNAVFNKCIKELVIRGKICPQIEGKLYYPVD